MCISELPETSLSTLREVWHRPSTVGERILDYIRVHYAAKGVSPTFDEIKMALGMSSSSHVAYWLDKLERQDKIERVPHTTRNIVLRNSVLLSGRRVVGVEVDVEVGGEEAS